jgi:8-oxo-dGTP pyrophosphatase MutT (NUDIX family)
MAEALIPRDASTIMLVRDGEQSLEVLMVRRNLKSNWVGGMHLFPGGAVDDDDHSTAIAAHCEGRDDAQASRILGIDSGGLGSFVAAIRECFEEAGILLATGLGRDEGDDPAAREAREARLVEHRRKLNSGETTLLAVCEAEKLTLDLSHIGYFSHWITPEGAPRRYDTRFFVAKMPEAQEALHDDVEIIDTVWIEPTEALRRQRAGEIEMMFPTIKNVEAIARFERADDLLDATAAAEVPTIMPRFTVEGQGVRILLPGDDGYEEATGLPEGVPFPDDARRASTSSNG